MRKIKTPFIHVIALIIAFASKTYGTEFCKSILDKTTLVIESLDAEYRRVFYHEEGNKRTAQITGLLNRTFFPMLDQLSRHVTKLDEQSISAELQKVRKKHPIRLGSYEIYYNRRIPKVVNESLSNLFHHNAQGAHFYRLFDRENVKQFNSMFYVEFPKEREQRLGVTHKNFGSVITPIGEYGPEFAKKMLRTTEILNRFADDTLTDLSIEAFEKNPILLGTEAGRVNGARNEGSLPKLGAKSAVLEGIISFHQMVTSMLAEKIPGLETGE